MAIPELANYPTYRNLPPLAGLASMERAVKSDWSLDESVERQKRLHYVLKRLYETLTARITGEPIYELKTAFSYHAYLCAAQVTLIRKRVCEMREPPLGLENIPHAGLERLMDEVIAAPTTEMLLLGVYEVALPAILRACKRLKNDAHPLADAPTVRVAKLIEFELADAAQFVAAELLQRLHHRGFADDQRRGAGRTGAAPGNENRIMHARLRVDNATFTAMDDMPDAPSTPNHGFWVSLIYDKPADAKRTYQSLETGAKNVVMPLQKTFWAEQFAMVVDRFGTPWMINGGMVPM